MRTRLLTPFTLLLFLILPHLSLAVESSPLSGKLVITGSSTVAPLVLEVGKRFEKAHPGVRVDVQTGGSSRGVADVRQNLADIGMVSRALNPDEQELKAFPIALDGISIILHKNNPLVSLSEEQIVGIYRGQIKNWKDVGGKDGPITVVNKAEGRSTLELFEKYFKIKNSEIKSQVIIGDNEQGIKTIAGNPGSIGYVSIGTAEFAAGNGVPIKLLPLQGISATVEEVKAGKYPLSRPLNLVTKDNSKALARSFLDFAQSAGVEDLVKEQYFVTFSKK